MVTRVRQPPEWLETYAGVEERIAKFRADHPAWPMTTEILEASGVFRTRTVIRDDAGVMIADGHAQVDADEDDALERCETSSRGRALVNLGYLTEKDLAGGDPADASETPGKRASVRPARTPATAGEAELQTAHAELRRRLAELDDADRQALSAWAERLGLPHVNGMSLGQIQRTIIEIDRIVKGDAERQNADTNTAGK